MAGSNTEPTLIPLPCYFGEEGSTARTTLHSVERKANRRTRGELEVSCFTDFTQLSHTPRLTRRRCCFYSKSNPFRGQKKNGNGNGPHRRQQTKLYVCSRNGEWRLRLAEITLLVSLVTTTIETTHASALAHQGPLLRRWQEAGSVSGTIFQ